MINKVRHNSINVFSYLIKDSKQRMIYRDIIDKSDYDSKSALKSNLDPDTYFNMKRSKSDKKKQFPKSFSFTPIVNRSPLKQQKNFEQDIGEHLYKISSEKNKVINEQKDNSELPKHKLSSQIAIKQFDKGIERLFHAFDTNEDGIISSTDLQSNCNYKIILVLSKEIIQMIEKELKEKSFNLKEFSMMFKKIYNKLLVSDKDYLRTFMMNIKYPFELADNCTFKVLLNYSIAGYI